MALSFPDFLSFFDKMFNVLISRLVFSCDKGWGYKAYTLHCIHVGRERVTVH